LDDIRDHGGHEKDFIGQVGSEPITSVIAPGSLDLRRLPGQAGLAVRLTDQQAAKIGWTAFEGCGSRRSARVTPATSLRAADIAP
jgi:hypothetical protein